MDPFVQRVIADVSLSTLEKYKHYYTVFSKSSIEVRNELEIKIKKDILDFKGLIKKQEIANAIRGCLKFQYLKIKYVFRGYGGRTLDEDHFYKMVASAIEWINVDNMGKANFSSYMYYSKFTNEKSLKDFELCLESEDNFVKIITEYAFKNATLNKDELNFQIIDLCLVDDMKFFDPKYIFLNERKEKYLNNTFKIEFEEKIKEIQAKIREEQSSWFPSKSKIRELEQNILEANKTIKFEEIVKNNFNLFCESFNEIRKYKQLIFDNLHWGEALESLDSLNKGVSLKHFLLEKGYDMGMFTGKLD